MPELPEVEIVRRGLAKKIIGETIEKVVVFREQSVGYPGVKRFSKLMPGFTFTEVSRRGKYLVFSLKKTGTAKQGFLIVHLRMSGRLLLLAPEEALARNLRFLRVTIQLSGGRNLYFEDMRVFGRLCFVNKEQDFVMVGPSFGKLGVEPLEDLNAERLLSLFQKKKQAIKTILLDQSLIAGIGNIYADEILFQTGVHPLTPALEISAKKAHLFAKVIPETLETAISRGGSSIKDFVDSDGVNGNYQHESLVYGRAKQPCRKCKAPIKRIKVGGRSTHFCPNCQRKKG